MDDVGRIGVAMRPKKGPGSRAIAELAERQHGVVARRQLVEIGFSPEAVKRRLRSGALHQLHRGVYAVGHRRVSLRGRLMAAVLACGPVAVLSHRSAALVWGLRDYHGRIDVTAPRSRDRLPGIVVHRVRKLDRRDVTIRDGIPITTLVRTLLDHAEVANKRHTAHTLRTADRLGLLDMRAIDDILLRSPGRRGLRPLSAALEQLVGPSEPTRSPIEDDLFGLCRAYDLPLPAANAVVEGHTVDALWPNEKLIAEVDSRAHHLNRTAFEEDRRRDARLQVAGYRVIRITYRRLTEEPAQVAAELRAMLTEPACAP
jgi:hypothetical protein